MTFERQETFESNYTASNSRLRLDKLHRSSVEIVTVDLQVVL